MPSPYHLVFALLVIWGAAWVIADSKLSLPFRHWVVTKRGDQSGIIMLLECPACLSFWFGLGAGAFLGMGFLLSIEFGLAACGVSFVLASFTMGKPL
jgi:hypothetical protein